MTGDVVPVVLLIGSVAALTVVLAVLGRVLGPHRQTPVKSMPYESGKDPFHSARRRFHVRYYLLAVALLVFDVELVLLYPWAVASRTAEMQQYGAPAPAALVSVEQPVETIDAAVATGWIETRRLAAVGALVFFGLLALGLVYDLRRGVFQWR